MTAERARARYWLAAALAAVAAVTIATMVPATVRPARAQLLSPGELSRAHAALEGDTRCFECHSSGRRTDDALCTKCHRDVASSVRAGTGLHGKAFRGKPCSECHVEHRGASSQIIRWPGGSQARFDHAQTGYRLEGAHAKAECAACHTTKNERGAPTFIGVPRDCASCHKDPHEKRLGNDCSKCHDETSWKRVELQRFDHALARFALRGKHADVQCSQCHGEPPKTKYHPLEFSSCTSCHKDPHENHFGGECTSCHNEKSWTDVSMQRGAHPGLSLGGGHANVRCASCHDRGNTKPPSRGGRCVACHQNVHDAKLGTDCAECHKRIQWLGVADPIGRAVHEKTAFPLSGLHREVECTDCHAPKLAPEKRYRQLAFARCLDCHKDPHGGSLTEHGGGDCKSCHDEHGFLPTHFGVAAHSATSFPLIGKHAAVACGLCHGDAHPRLQLGLEKRECAQCHANPHGAQFSSELAAGGCAHCHSPTGWDVPKIDHKTWPLTGAHARTACASCHDESTGARTAGEGASYRGVPRDCEGCHEDTHRGQFRLSEPARGCADCHGTEAFQIPRFDHARSAGYPLEGAHEQVKCEQCHLKAELRNGEEAVRYRLGYRRCADCHKDPHAGATR
jgi:hypothetical protein